jgi:hypothetical protein
MWFGTANTERMRIDENGNVGIGTDDPSEMLTVAGNVSALGGLSANGSDNLFTGNVTTNGTIYAGAKVERKGDTNTYLLFESDLVNLVAGGNSAIKLENSTGKIRLNNTNADLDVQITGNNGNVVFHSDAGTNKVGIGTQTPGYKLHVVESNTSTVAISAFGEIHAGGDIISSSSSDRRQKTNIKKLDNALDKVLTLDGVEYDWNEMAAAHRIGKHDVGVIAQQVEEVLPDAVEHRETGMMAVRYERLVPLLIEAIKELKSEIDELKGK